MKRLLCILGTVAFFVAACGDATGPNRGFEASPLKPVFEGGEEIVVVVRNHSDRTLYIGDYTELAWREPTRWRQVSVAGCGLPRLPAWHAIEPGSSVTCRHPTALSFPAGDYHLNVAVLRDTTVHTGMTASATFRIAY